MSLMVRNAVPCERLVWTDFFTLERVRFAWSEPPEKLFLWVEVINPAEREAEISVQVFRRTTLIQETGEELLLGNSRRFEVDIELTAGDLDRKTYTIRVLLNGVAAHALTLDFGAKEPTWVSRKNPVRSRKSRSAWFSSPKTAGVCGRSPQTSPASPASASPRDPCPLISRPVASRGGLCHYAAGEGKA